MGPSPSRPNFDPLPPDVFPVRFVWPTSHGGRSVQLTGSFSKWRDRIEMDRNPDGSFSTVIDLPAGNYDFKFLVDGEWRYTGTLPTHTDPVGNVNNTITVSAETAFNGAPSGAPSRRQSRAASRIGHSPAPPPATLPARDSAEFWDYFETGIPVINLPAELEPPDIAPALAETVLSTSTSTALAGAVAVGEALDPVLLPLPDHASLTHLFTAGKYQGCTIRYRRKFISTIYVAGAIEEDPALVDTLQKHIWGR